MCLNWSQMEQYMASKRTWDLYVYVWCSLYLAATQALKCTLNCFLNSRKIWLLFVYIAQNHRVGVHMLCFYTLNLSWTENNCTVNLLIGKMNITEMNWTSNAVNAVNILNIFVWHFEHLNEKVSSICDILENRIYRKCRSLQSESDFSWNNFFGTAANELTLLAI